MNIHLLLLIVAYHPSSTEVNLLKRSLDCLPANIQYAVFANEYIDGEPVTQLFDDSLYYLLNDENIGYGRAVNLLHQSSPFKPEFIGILNTDLSWFGDIFTPMYTYLLTHTDVNLLAPKILNNSGEPEYLCKQNPTMLALLSRRFVPEIIKPNFLRRYDRWYTMQDFDYDTIFEVPYLSGCCMVARSSAFNDISGFDQRYFLYLEDADLTRSLSISGRCLHYPHSSVIHEWGRGNYKSLKLVLVNLISAWQYFSKWGLALW